MAFELPGHFVWDFWLAHNGGDFHLYFLAAPRANEHPDLRHPRASIHHASSSNLMDWSYHGVAIAPSPEPAWDDCATWTGSVIRRPDGAWKMFYTGVARKEACRIQRIGAAISTDLHHWTKVAGNPIIELSGETYERYDPKRWHDQAFRDPWVYRDPGGPGWRMLFTARDPHRPAKGAGAIGQACSPDLVNWTLGEPLYRADHYGEMEMPQLFALDGWWYCLFSNSVRHREPSYVDGGRAGSVTGTHYLRSTSPHGPFALVEEEFFAGDPTGLLYGGRAVDTGRGHHIIC